MRYGSLPRSIARSLSDRPIGQNFSPDGLDEAAIDVLINEAYAEVTDVLPQSPTPADSTEHRRVRRQVRQVVRSLPDSLPGRSDTTSSTSGEAA